MHRAWLIILAGGFLLPMASCSREDQTKRAQARLPVVVSILPQAYFLERIGGPLVDVHVLVGPGRSPHTFEPTPRQMVQVTGSRLYFRVGVPFEDALCAKLSGSTSLQIVDTRKGITLRPIDPEDPDETGREHADADHHHEAGEKDPHIWLSPALVKIQAQTICDALCQADPAHRSDFRGNLESFQADLDRLDNDIAAALAPLKGRRIYVFHPAFGYFASRYGLVQESVETGGKSPGPRHIKMLVEKARADGVRVIFVQPEFSDQAAQAVAAEIGGVVVPMDPLAKDYLQNLHDMADKVHKALTTGS